MMIADRPIRIFYSYAHEDKRYRVELGKHLAGLRREGLVEDWHDRMITPGTPWDDEIQQRLEGADVILLLLSSDFLSSDYCQTIEIPRALKRLGEGAARVVPIVVRAVQWKTEPLSSLQVLPPEGKPVESWPSENEAWSEVVKGLHRVCDEVRRGVPPPPWPPPVAPLRVDVSWLGSRSGTGAHVVLGAREPWEGTATVRGARARPPDLALSASVRRASWPRGAATPVPVEVSAFAGPAEAGLTLRLGGPASALGLSSPWAWRARRLTLEVAEPGADGRRATTGVVVQPRRQRGLAATLSVASLVPLAALGYVLAHAGATAGARVAAAVFLVAVVLAGVLLAVAARGDWPFARAWQRVRVAAPFAAACVAVTLCGPRIALVRIVNDTPLDVAPRGTNGLTVPGHERRTAAVFDESLNAAAFGDWLAGEGADRCLAGVPGVATDDEGGSCTEHSDGGADPLLALLGVRHVFVSCRTGAVLPTAALVTPAAPGPTQSVTVRDAECRPTRPAVALRADWVLGAAGPGTAPAPAWCRTPGADAPATVPADAVLEVRLPATAVLGASGAPPSAPRPDALGLCLRELGGATVRWPVGPNDRDGVPPELEGMQLTAAAPAARAALWMDPKEPLRLALQPAGAAAETLVTCAPRPDGAACVDLVPLLRTKLPLPAATVQDDGPGAWSAEGGPGAWLPVACLPAACDAAHPPTPPSRLAITFDKAGEPPEPVEVQPAPAIRALAFTFPDGGELRCERQTAEGSPGDDAILTLRRAADPQVVAPQGRLTVDGETWRSTWRSLPGSPAWLCHTPGGLPPCQVWEGGRPVQDPGGVDCKAAESPQVCEGGGTQQVCAKRLRPPPCYVDKWSKKEVPPRQDCYEPDPFVECVEKGKKKVQQVCP